MLGSQQQPSRQQLLAGRARQMPGRSRCEPHSVRVPPSPTQTRHQNRKIGGPSVSAREHSWARRSTSQRCVSANGDVQRPQLPLLVSEDRPSMAQHDAHSWHARERCGAIVTWINHVIDRQCLRPSQGYPLLERLANCLPHVPNRVSTTVRADTTAGAPSAMRRGGPEQAAADFGGGSNVIRRKQPAAPCCR